MSEHKHFNMGNVWGRVTEVKEELSKTKKPYLSITVDISGTHCGQARAYVRMWGEQRCREFMEHYKGTGGGSYHFKGFLSQYDDDKKAEVVTYNNFTCYHWESTTQAPRAAFVLKGEVATTPSRLRDGGQYFLLLVRREGGQGYDATEEKLALWAPGEKLLDTVKCGDVVEVKGLVRQKDVNDLYGGSDGPVNAYIDVLRVME